LPPTDSVPLADYLPSQGTSQRACRPDPAHPITISVKPGHLVLLKGSSTLSIGTSMDQPSSGHSHDTHWCQAQWVPPMAAPLKKLKGAVRTETYQRHYCQHSSFKGGSH
jgi:hypothetical protein